MALFDRLNSIAKNVGDRAGEAIELTKLNTKIRVEKSAINDLYAKIGAYYYEKFTAGDPLDPEVSDYLAQIEGHQQTIRDAEEQLAAMKQEEAAAAEPVPQPQAPAAGLVCGACGKLNASGTRFCAECGAKLESEPKARVCPGCGAQVEPGVRFCGKCGSKVE